MEHCPHCDSRLKKNTKFCPECGMPVGKEICVVNDDHSNQSGKKVLGIILMLVFLVTAITVVFFLVSPNSTKNSTTEETVLLTSSNISIAFSDDPTAITVASQSVVKLECYDKNGKLYSTGSAFACFADDVIVTNYHVIEGNVYEIKASTETGQCFDVRYVLAADRENDIALLTTITPHNLPLLQVGDSENLKKGEKVVAIGSPLGLINTVSSGVFSGYTDGNGIETLQFTASISSGSSGGALFNDLGEVIGITFASYEAGQNLNLAIPIEIAEQLYTITEPNGCITLEHFYDTHIPTYSVDQVVGLGTELEGEVFYIEGYIHSHGVVCKANGEDWETVWCEVYSNAENGVCSGNCVQISYTAAENEKIPFDLILSNARARKLNQGDLARFRCEFRCGATELTLIVIEHVE